MSPFVPLAGAKRTSTSVVDFEYTRPRRRPCTLLGRRTPPPQVGYNPGSVVMNQLIGKDNPLRW
jgi:hypothetical protein